MRPSGPDAEDVSLKLSIMGRARRVRMAVDVADLLDEFGLCKLEFGVAQIRDVGVVAAHKKVAAAHGALQAAVNLLATKAAAYEELRAELDALKAAWDEHKANAAHLELFCSLEDFGGAGIQCVNEDPEHRSMAHPF